MKVLEKVEVLQSIKLNKPKFKVIILKVKPNSNSFNGQILGRSVSDWIVFACRDIKDVSVLDYDKKRSPIEFIREYLDDRFDYTLLLLSTTPLIENSDINTIIEYVSVKKSNLCKLPTGYVINNKYVIGGGSDVDSIYSINIDNFYVVETKKQYSYALNVLQERINNFHSENGVDIIKPQSIYIEPEVDIESGVVIYPNTSLKGKSSIGKGVIIKENTVISDSKIGKNSCISGSVIDGSIVSQNVYISPFCEISNSLIGANTTIEKGAVIKNYNIDAESKINANTVLGESNDSNSGLGKSR